MQEETATKAWEMETEVLYQGSYYIAIGKIVSQTGAQLLCEGAPFNGHLASVHSDEEQRVVTELCLTMPLSHTWEMNDRPGFANSCCK